MDGIYQVFLNTPMGRIEGKLFLKQEGENLEGYLEALGNQNKIERGSVNGNLGEFSGKISYFLGTISYQAKVKIEQEKLQAIVSSNLGEFQVIGTKLESKN